MKIEKREIIEVLKFFLSGNSNEIKIIIVGKIKQNLIIFVKKSYERDFSSSGHDLSVFIVTKVAKNNEWSLSFEINWIILVSKSMKQIPYEDKHKIILLSILQFPSIIKINIYDVWITGL